MEQFGLLMLSQLSSTKKCFYFKDVKKKLQSLDRHLKQEKPDETWEKSGFLPEFFFFFFSLRKYCLYISTAFH